MNLILSSIVVTKEKDLYLKGYLVKELELDQKALAALVRHPEQQC
jgi:hypothetical protein